MKTYQVTIKAVIEKTFSIEAENEDEAYEEAHDLFNPYSGEAETHHETTTLDIIEVTA
jgi:hypothetical protein